MPSKPPAVAEYSAAGRERSVHSNDRWRPGRALGVLGLLLSMILVGGGVASAEDAPLWADKMARAEPEPIAYIGHGAFFAADGQQIVPTADFVERAQRWYRAKLLSGLGEEQQLAFADFELSLLEGLDVRGQGRLLLEQRSLDWLLQRAPQSVASPRMRGKLGLLGYRLLWQLPPTADLEHLRELRDFTPDAATLARLESVDAALELTAPLGSPGLDALATTNDGQDYIDECDSWDVPIPPAIGVMDPAGTAGWKILGLIPTAQQFIVGTPAQVRSFKSPDGMCIALPRYTNGTLSTVALDGVICLSSVTSKVCIWDNQMSGLDFSFPASAQIPIGVPDLGIDPMGRYQGGGFELLGGTGGVCTDCHAGENPYIIHPDANLGGGLLFGDLADPPHNLPMFAPNRYDPIVAAAWPQNDLSHSQALVAPVCAGCHSATGPGGRFPHLSTDLPGYCGVVLAQAVDNSLAGNSTMPPWAPGSEVGSVDVIDFRDWCGEPVGAGPSNRGDPHLRTVDNVNYDFQSAGEFTALRNSATGFELQTRQTGVTTTFNPGPNAYTGLSNCAALNTAAAVRLGEHRASVQPSVHGICDRDSIVLYLDGVQTTVPPGGIDLGDGNRIAEIGNGDGYEFRASDGTRVLVTDHFWASQGYSYLNVEVLDTPAREGTMGTIVGDDWLPRAPDGSSFGPAPWSLASRDYLLNMTFADAWRITNSNSLFEYAPGTSTATFTDRSWPPPNGSSCQGWTPVPPVPACGPRKVAQSIERAEAEMFCFRFLEQEQKEGIFEECVFDVGLMGNPQMAEALEFSLKVRELPCGTCWPDRDPDGGDPTGGGQK